MGEQLTALDATFLELEEADQSAHMHIGGVIVLEPGPRGGAPPIEEIRRDVVSRLPDLPRYRQRLSAPHTGGLHWPSWEEDTGFRVERHVRRAGLPTPGGIEELCEWAGEYYSQRLDRTKPLWEMTILELADGRWAIVTKTHHCMIDGVGSVDMAATLLDTERESRIRSDNGGSTGNGAQVRVRVAESVRPAWRRGLERIVRPGLALGHAGVRTAEAGLNTIESLVGVATHPSRAREVLQRSRALAELVVRDEVIAAPSCSLNRPISGERRLAVIGVQLEELKEIKRALGGTVNDVVLAASAGALRKLLIGRGEEPPEQGLRAMVPVNVRTAGDRLAMGNRISSLFVHLPVSVADPMARYIKQIEEAESLKSGSQTTGSSTLIEVTRHMPPVVHSVLARSMYATRLFNVTITNVPGPQTPLFYFGSKVREIWPLVPIAAEHAVGLAVFSYDGTLYFCVNADRDTVEDLDVLAKGIAESVAELHELAAPASR
jgi:diacylglycerol O-acyltransferase